MRYVGGKVRLAKRIALAMQVPADAHYVEPFLGGGATMQAHAHIANRTGADNNRYLIALHQAVQNGWHPPAETITRELYHAIKDDKDSYPAEMVGFVGFCSSMHGAFFRGYVGIPGDHNQVNHLTLAESGRNVLLKAAPRMLGVKLFCRDYTNLSIPDGSYVYCDPPYRGTLGYGSGFDHDAFWLWADHLRQRCKVFVSELQAPEGWSTLWSEEISAMSSGVKQRRRTEKIFV